MKTDSSINRLKHSASLYTYILIVWGFYRVLFQLPEPLEELILKPLLWLLPLYFFVRSEKGSFESIGLSFKNIFPTIYFALILGVFFSFEGLLVNYAKHGGLKFDAYIGSLSFWSTLGISFATAFTEEVVFRGYIFNRVWKAINSEWGANIMVSVGWMLIHFPIAFFDWKLDPTALVVYLGLVFLYSLGASFIFARTQNVFSSIFLHVLWQWPIILFR